MRVTATRPHAPRLTATLREKESVTPLELFFDLVFVLALTQCTALMAKEPTWEGLAKAMLVLAVLWWSWGGYAWLTSLVDPEEGIVRIAMFGAMAAFLVAALCVPEAFDETALLFAVAYAGVRAAHIVLFAIGSRDDAEPARVGDRARGQHRDRGRAAGRGVVRRRADAGRDLGGRDPARLRRARTSSASRAGGWCRATSPSASA